MGSGDCPRAPCLVGLWDMFDVPSSCFRVLGLGVRCLRGSPLRRFLQRLKGQGSIGFMASSHSLDTLTLKSLHRHPQHSRCYLSHPPTPSNLKPRNEEKTTLFLNIEPVAKTENPRP